MFDDHKKSEQTGVLLIGALVVLLAIACIVCANI